MTPSFIWGLKRRENTGPTCVWAPNPPISIPPLFQKKKTYISGFHFLARQYSHIKHKSPIQSPQTQNPSPQQQKNDVKINKMTKTLFLGWNSWFQGFLTSVQMVLVSNES